MANTMRLEPYVPEDDGKCSRGCCWTPYGCAHSRLCPCHPVTFNKWMKQMGVTDE